MPDPCAVAEFDQSLAATTKTAARELGLLGGELSDDTDVTRCKFKTQHLFHGSGQRPSALRAVEDAM